MRILYLAHRIPWPPDKGEKIRIFNQMRELSKRHAIHLCCFVDDSSGGEEIVRLDEYCVSVGVVPRNNRLGPGLVLSAFWAGSPLSIQVFKRRAFAKLVDRTMSEMQVDCIIASCSSMAQYALLYPNIPKVIDFIDVDSEKWRGYAELSSFPLSAIYRRETNTLSCYEGELVRCFDHTVVSTAVEVEALKRHDHGNPVSAVSNGVDLEYFNSTLLEIANNRPIIVFTGVMDYFPNIDAVKYFCESIFPRVRDAIQNAQFHIVGRNPTRQVKRLAKQNGVIVTGTVPDVRPYLAQAAVAVAPFRIARGVQNKILEAMAMGLPVVGTTETFKGVAATEADGIRVADDPESFAGHVIALLQADADTRRRLAKQTRAYVERHHRWEDQGDKLERILIDVVERRRRPMVSEVKSAILA